MNQRPEPSEFLSDEDYVEAVASMLSPSDELEIITGGHRSRTYPGIAAAMAAQWSQVAAPDLLSEAA